MKNDSRAISTGILIISSFSLFLYGFIDNLKGVTLPLILSDLSISYSKGGAIQQGAYFGFLIASLFTGFLIQRFSHRNILIFAVSFLAIGVFIYSMSFAFPFLLFAMIMIGLGLGFLDLGGIRLITDFCTKHTGRLLNLSAFFHGFASITSPLFAGYLIGKSFTWNAVYQSSLLFVCVFFFTLLFIQIPSKNPDKSKKIDIKNQIGKALGNRRMWAYYFLIISYESIEIGIAVWLSEFLQSGSDLSASLGTSFLSIFFLFLTIGRLIGSFIVERVGNKKMILFSSIGVTICLTLGIYGGNQLLFFLPLTGLFLSTIFPTTTASASQDIHEYKDISLSFFFTFAGLGGMMGSWLIGLIANLTNIKTGFSFLILMASMITVAIVIIINFNKTRNSSHSLEEH